MNSYSNTLFVISIFLVIFFIGCQAHENKETIDESASFNRRLNDVTYFSKNIGKSDSKLSLMSGYVENKNQQKRRVNESRNGVRYNRIKKRIAIIKNKKPVRKYIKMKYRLYNDINILRQRYSVGKLKVNVALSKELQKYVERIVKVDLTYKYRKLKPEDIIYIYKQGEKYDPLGFWSKDVKYLIDRPFEKWPDNEEFTRLIWKSSTHIGCGLSGAKSSSSRYRIVVYCRITPKGNIKGKYAENVFIMPKKKIF
uniref:SCP domain-containing protein n=1 Tax=Strongyloides venezuelensis TaxID=75913 RepID=A0A0K0EZW0_STRVS